MSSVFSKAFSRDPWVEPFVFANLSSFVAFVSTRACASVHRRLRISFHVSCARRSCISGFFEFSSWCLATKQRRAGKETQTTGFWFDFLDGV